MEEKVSVVIPVYNVQDYVEECIKSVLNQSYRNLEVIIVDDGSTDDSIAVIQSYIDTDDRVTLVRTENGGLSHARNIGLEYATSHYVTFLDSDDWVEPNFIEVLYRNLTDYNADISVVNFRNVVDGQVVTRYQLPHYTKVYSSLEVLEALYGQKEDSISLNFTIACGKLYKTALFGTVRYPLGKKHEDEFTTYKLYMKSENVVYEHVALYNYRIRQGSITQSSYNLSRLDAVEALQERLEVFEQSGIDTLQTKYALCYLLAKNMVGLKRIGEYEKCKLLRTKLDSTYKTIFFELPLYQKVKLLIFRYFSQCYF